MANKKRYFSQNSTFFPTRTFILSTVLELGLHPVVQEEGGGWRKRCGAAL